MSTPDDPTRPPPELGGLDPQQLFEAALRSAPLQPLPPDPDVTLPVAGPRASQPSASQLELPLPEELTALLPAAAYQVESFLGQGGMGAVYKGVQVRLKRPVAIKIMRRDFGKDHDFEARFEREAQAMAKLNHPGIVSVIDYGEAGSDYLYIVMELVDGADLMDVIRTGRMTQEMALTLLPQICDALQFAHDHGIVHRDIKPSNIMLTRDGRIKMADFGLAKRYDVESSFRTQTGTGMGTPDYAAPEQFDPHGNVDHRADIYALGVMIYQMVTGTLPRGAWKPPSEKADVDTHWDNIVSHALQTDPSDRYASVSEIKTDISSIALPAVAGVCDRGGAKLPSTKSTPHASAMPPVSQRPQSGDSRRQRPATRKSPAPLLYGLAGALMIAAGGYFAWDKFAAEVRPISVTNPAASATPALPTPIRLWDAADKIPKQPGVSWEDDALRLDDREVAHVFPVVQRVAVKTSIRVNPDTAQVKLGLRQRSRDEGAYFLYVDFANSILALLIEGQGKKGTLKTWKMPRQYRPGEWLPVELRVVDGETSVSLEGKLLGMVHDSTFSDFTALTLAGTPYAHFRDIEVVPLDPSWTNRPPAPSIPVTETVAETVQRPVPKPATWVDATTEVRDDVVQAGAGAVQGDWLALSKSYNTRLPDSRIFRNAVVRMSFKGVAGMSLRTSLTDLSYQCVLNTDRTLGLFTHDGFTNTRVHFNKVVKLEPDFDLLAEHELVMSAEEDLMSVWLDGRLMLSQRDGNLAQGRITLMFGTFGRDASLLPHVRKVEYADLGGTPAVPAPQSAVSRTWQAPTPTVTVGTEWTNLIPHIKPERDVIRGGWTVDEKGLTAQRAEWAICNLPVQDPGTDYDLRYKVTRGEGSHLAMFFAFRNGSTGGYVPIDYIYDKAPEFADGQRWATLEDLTHLEMRDDATIKAKRKEWLPRGKTCTVLLQVREKEVIVSVDDEEAFRWPAEWSKLQQRGGAGGSMFLDVSGGPIFGVGIYNCEAVFHSIEMRRISEPKTPTSAATPATATKDVPFENTLGMKFVPVPISGGPTDGKRVLFSMWETRMQDYEAFVKETKREWEMPQLKREPSHPAVMVSWEDATAFCVWLTDRERTAGKLAPNERYGLPTDHEWSCAVGIGDQEDASKTPQEKSRKITDVFPWGGTWPPPAGTGNYAGEELQAALAAGKYVHIKSVLTGYHDSHELIAPVGSFPASSLGLHDLSGNVWEWCADWLDASQKACVLRGGSWDNSEASHLLSSDRISTAPDKRSHGSNGFRCVVTASAPTGHGWSKLPTEEDK